MRIRSESSEIMAPIPVLFLLAAVAGVSIAQEYGDICKLGSTSFSQCLEGLANNHFASLNEVADGIYHVWKPSNVTMKNGPLILDADYVITKFVNTTMSLKLNLKYDDTTQNLIGTIEAPQMIFGVNANVNGKFFNAKLKGTVVAFAKLYDVNAAIETKLSITPDEKPNFKLGQLKFNVENKRKTELEFIEIHAPNKGIEVGMREIFKRFPDLAFSLAKPNWQGVLRMHYEDLLNDFVKDALGNGLIAK